MADGSKIAGGLYLRKVKGGSHQGQTYLGGIITLPDGSKLSLRIFRNTRKQSSKHPDYLVYSDFVDGQRNQRQTEASSQDPHGNDGREVF